MSSTITVPFCHLPNSKTQTFDFATCQRSEYQIQFLKEISERPDFAYFSIQHRRGVEMIVDPSYPTKFCAMWWTKDGNSHVAMVGTNKIRSWLPGKDPQARPAPEDSVVYTSRTQP